MELALEWIDRHYANLIIRDRLIMWMVHICLRQFRVDVLRSIQSEIVAEDREEALQGNDGFCFEYLEEIMSEPVYLSSGNRSNYKKPWTFEHFLFDFENRRIRRH